MEQLRIKSGLFTLEQQLIVLERAKVLVQNKNSKWGLCCAIEYAMVLEFNISRFGVGIFKDDIPLFTKENAVKYGKYYGKGVYWWETEPYDFKSRLDFLNWMITQIKQEIENGKSTN